MNTPTQVPLPELDKEKYLNLVKSDGLAAAITALHHEMWEIENQSFEGVDGYRPDVFDKLQEYREFSGELWEIRQQVADS